MSEYESGEPEDNSPPPPPPNMAPPPGYVAYGDPNYRGYASLQNVGGLGRSIVVILLMLIPLTVVSILVSFDMRGKAQDFLDGTMTETSFKNSFSLTFLVGAVVGLATLATFVLTIIWMFRLAKNQQALGRNGTWTPGWAIGGWFLPPCVLYIIPYLMMRDLWKSSDPASGPDWKKNPVAPIVNIWWVLYGLIPVVFIPITLSSASLRSGSSVSNSKKLADAAHNLVDTFNASTASAVVQLAAAGAYLLLVLRLTERHKQLIRES